MVYQHRSDCLLLLWRDIAQHQALLDVLLETPFGSSGRLTNTYLCAKCRLQVYQVIHEGVVKAAKKTNLTRLGVGKKDIDRVFERFVKELYILSQMHSDRCVCVRLFNFYTSTANWLTNEKEPLKGLVAG